MSFLSFIFFGLEITTSYYYDTFETNNIYIYKSKTIKINKYDGKKLWF